MVFFGKKKETESKDTQKARKYLQSRGIDKIDPSYSQQVNRISADLAGNSFLKAGMALSMAKSSEQATVTYLSAQVEQNWILIKQQDQILKELQKLNRNIH